jgi:hypothetical protein
VEKAEELREVGVGCCALILKVLGAIAAGRDRDSMRSAILTEGKRLQLFR